MDHTPASKRPAWRLAPPAMRAQHPAIRCLANVPADSPGPQQPTPLAAAQYIRMSTEHQQYSTTNQREAIAAYAARHALSVVRTYADEGRSGLNIQGRPGLAALIEDVAAGRAGFEVLLVYDVSRWGRFQDCDESAYYEFLCRKMGIQVRYCMEAFTNDGSPVSMVLKALKRVMAAEYSRELSVKVFQAKCQLVRRGFRSGGVAGYGLRRMLVDAKGSPRGILEPGQSKFIQTDRVVIVPGPREELEVVRWIFRQAAVYGRRPSQIAAALNRRGQLRWDKPWKGPVVLSLLCNEEYIGNLVFNRKSAKLKGPTRPNPREQWVRCEGAFPTVLPPALFYRAQDAIAAWSSRTSSEAALDALRRLLEREGRLSAKLVAASDLTPPLELYRCRFGGLSRAYSLIGYSPKRDYGFLKTHGQRRRQAAELRARVIQELSALGARAQPHQRVMVLVGGHYRVMVAMGYYKLLRGPVCAVQVHIRPAPHCLLVARLDHSNTQVVDYWLLRGGTSVVLGTAHRKDRDRASSATLGPIIELLARWASAASPPPPVSAQGIGP